MPSTKRKRKRFSFKRKRKGAKRPRRRGRRVPPRRRAIKTFPKKVYAELTYCENVTVQNKYAGPIGGAQYKFRLNSIFDPNETAGGHQPRGHDQWEKIYNKYCVVAAKVRVEPLFAVEDPVAPIGQSNVDTACTVFGYIDDDTTTDLWGINSIIELGLHSSHKYVSVGDGGKSNTKRYYKNPNMYWNIGMKKFFGISKKTQIIRSSGLGQGDGPVASKLAAEFGNNPAQVCCLKLHVSDTNASAKAPSYVCRVTIKYKVIIYDPKEIGASV